MKFALLQVGRCETNRFYDFGRKRFAVSQMFFMLENECRSLAFKQLILICYCQIQFKETPYET